MDLFLTILQREVPEVRRKNRSVVHPISFSLSFSKGSYEDGRRFASGVAVVEVQEVGDAVPMSAFREVEHVLSIQFIFASSPPFRFSPRYGNKMAEKQYKKFSEFYAKTFAVPVMEALLRQIENHRVGAWISPRVLQQAFSYIGKA